MIETLATIDYLCPACGNPFYGSGIASYNTFGAVRFSDGSISGNVPTYINFSRCPRCRRFFSVKHLFDIPFPPRERATYFRNGSHLVGKNNPDLFGRVAAPLEAEETEIDFLEKAITEELYFPVHISNLEKIKTNIELCLVLWREYNKCRSTLGEDKYNEYCRGVIGIIESYLIHDEKVEYLISIAEMSRNIGDFVSCERFLDRVSHNPRYENYVDCIRKLNDLRKKETIMLIDRSRTGTSVLTISNITKEQHYRGVTPPPPPPPPSGVNNETIQEWVRRVFSYLFRNNVLSADILELLHDKDYSMWAFGIRYALIVDRQSETRFSGYSRYWQKQIGKYYMCSEWWKENERLHDAKIRLWLRKNVSNYVELGLERRNAEK